MLWRLIHLLIITNTKIIFSPYQQQFLFLYMYIKILITTAQLTTNEMHVYCKLCIAVCFNEILV